MEVLCCRFNYLVEALILLSLIVKLSSDRKTTITPNTPRRCYQQLHDRLASLDAAILTNDWWPSVAHVGRRRSVEVNIRFLSTVCK